MFFAISMASLAAIQALWATVSAASVTWRRITRGDPEDPWPRPRGFLSSAQVLVEDKSAAIIVGGNMDFDPTEMDARPDAWLFWPHNSSFSQLPDLPIKSQGFADIRIDSVGEVVHTDFPNTGLWGHVVVSVESGVYLHGGQYYESGTKAHNQLYRLDLEEMTWNLHDNRGPALASHSAVAYASDIYIYGGKTRADAMEAGVKDLWKYKVVENEWIKIGPPPAKPKRRRHIQLEASEEQPVSGAANNARPIQKSTLGLSNLIWPSARSSHGATLTRNLKGKTGMLIAAGESKPAQFVDDVAWLYSMETESSEDGEWRQLDAPWQPREDVAMATDMEGRVLMYGGWDNTMDWPTDLWMYAANPDERNEDGENRRAMWTKINQAIGEGPGEIRGAAMVAGLVGQDNKIYLLMGCAHTTPEPWCEYSADVWEGTLSFTLP